MAKRKRLSVSWHEPSGQFTKWVGRTRGKDGKLKPKCFYLGSDETAAVAKAGSLRNEWKALKSRGIEARPEHIATVPPTPQPSPTLTNLTLEQAAKEYIDSFNLEAEARQITREHSKAIRYYIARVASHFGPQTPLVSIGEKQVKQFVLTFAARPEVSTWNGKPHQMAMSYARRIIREARAFLEWTHRQGYLKPGPSHLGQKCLK